MKHPNKTPEKQEAVIEINGVLCLHDTDLKNNFLILWVLYCVLFDFSLN